MTTKRTNVIFAAVGAALCLPLILITAILSGNPTNDTFLQRPSTFFTDGSGARAAYLVLEQVLPQVEQWRLPVSEMASLPESTPSSLIVMGPTRPLSTAEAAALDGWIASGGQLILATDEPWRVGVPRVFDDDDDNGEFQDYLERHGIDADSDAEVEDAVAEAQVVTVGAGRIVHVPNPYAFSNAALAETDNAVWLVDQCAGWGGTVRFDEYHHGFGQQRSFTAIMAPFLVSPWGLVCLQLGLAGAVYIFGYKRRFGRPVDPLPPERTSALETVEALGGLFEVADARRFSARAIHQYLSARLSGAMRRPFDLMDPAVRQHLAKRIGVCDTDLEAYAEGVEGIIAGRRNSDADLVEIGRQAAKIGSLNHGTSRSGRSLAAG